MKGAQSRSLSAVLRDRSALLIRAFLREDLPMANETEATRQLEDSRILAVSLWNRLLNLEGVSSGAGVARLLFDGYDGKAPPASTISTWFGVKRFSSPRQSPAEAAWVLSRVERLLDPDAAQQLRSIWEVLPNLLAAKRRAEGVRTVRPPDVLDSRSTARRNSLRWALFRHLDDAEGPLPAIDLDLQARFNMGSARTQSKVPPYVPRTADDELRRRLDAALNAGPDQWMDRIILASGPPAAGKTRSMLEVLRERVPTAAVIVKRFDASASIGDLANALLAAQREAMFDDPTLIVFVEDLHLLLGRSNLATDIQLLLDGPRVNNQRLILVGTIHDRVLRLSEHQMRFHGTSNSERDLLASASISYSGEFDPTEELAAHEQFPSFLESPQIGASGLHQLPACMASIDVLMGKITEAAGDPDLYIEDALIRSACDLTVIARHGGCYELLRTLTDRWVLDRHPTRQLPDEKAFDEAFRWATTPIGNAWAILHPIRGETRADDKWRLLDALSAELSIDHMPCAWIEAIADGTQLVDLAWWHFDNDRSDAALRILTSLAEGGDPSAMWWLADLLRELDEDDAARRWTVRSAELGDPSAMTDVGRAHRLDGDLGAAEKWLLRAVDTGDTDAMEEMALLRTDERDLLGAAEWYERAGAGNDPQIASRLIYNAGVIYREMGDLESAERCFRTAARGNYVFATDALGVLLANRGDLESAERLFLRGVNRNDASSMSNLGALLAQRGDPEESEAWCRRAADAGDPHGMFNLALRLELRDEIDEAHKWYQRAATAGDADAVRRVLELMERRQGD